MKKFPVLIPFFLLLSCLLAHARPVVDSVGVEKRGGKRFILHRVDQGQTLFAIARRYGRSVGDIRAANSDMGEAVRYAQVVRIPIPDGALSRKEAKSIDKAIRRQEKGEDRDTKVAPKTKKNDRKNDDPARAGIHVVEPGQTLYSLAVRYGVAQADLRKWNSLPSNNVLIGQALIVSEKAYQVRMPSTPTPAVAVRTTTPKRPDTPDRSTENRPVTRPEPTRSELPKPDRPTPKRIDEPTPAKDDKDDGRNPAPTSPATPKPDDVAPEMPRPGNDAPMPTRGRRVATSGVAEMIEGADGSGKYLALHRTAPMGTLVQVRNEFNNQSLWVKVIGRLPNTGINDKILIKLSAQAFTKLSPGDGRFRAEVSYIAP